MALMAVKSAGFELTELHLFSSWRPLEGAGLSASYDQVRWPDIRREEFVPLPADELDLQETRRGSLRLWAHAHEDVRLSLRGDWWRNESEDGSGGELRLDWRDLLWEHGRLSLGLFSQGGQFSAVEGLRLRVDRTAGSGHWSLGYELSRSEQEAFEGEQGELLRQSLRGSWDTRIGDDWSLSLFGEGIFGEAQEALSLGIFLQRSF